VQKITNVAVSPSPFKNEVFFSDKELKNEADALTPPDISAADVATGIPGQSLISPLCC